MKTITLLLAAILAGCASTPTSPVRGGTEHTVTVSFADVSMAEAVNAAEAHCQQYGRHAQFSGKSGFFVFYNCI